MMNEEEEGMEPLTQRTQMNYNNASRTPREIGFT
jgi:hypothetical protein